MARYSDNGSSLRLASAALVMAVLLMVVVGGNKIWKPSGESELIPDEYMGQEVLGETTTANSRAVYKEMYSVSSSKTGAKTQMISGKTTTGSNGAVNKFELEVKKPSTITPVSQKLVKTLDDKTSMRLCVRKRTVTSKASILPVVGSGLTVNDEKGKPVLKMMAGEEGVSAVAYGKMPLFEDVGERVGWKIGTPICLKIERKGLNLVASASTDEKNWSEIMTMKDAAKGKTLSGGANNEVFGAVVGDKVTVDADFVTEAVK